MIETLSVPPVLAPYSRLYGVHTYCLFSVRTITTVLYDFDTSVMNDRYRRRALRRTYSTVAVQQYIYWEVSTHTQLYIVYLLGVNVLRISVMTGM